MAPARRRGGRILPHQRDTDDAAPLLGADLDLGNDEFERQSNEIAELAMENKTRRDHRCRIVRIANFWKDNCPEYYAIGVIKVTDADLKNPSKFYFNRHKEDLVCTGLNVSMVKRYLMSTMKKANGKVKSLQDVRKYKDAILWGAKVAGQRLPTSFYEQIDEHIASYKKLYIKAKKEGDVDEKEADPIPLSLYQSMLKWAVEENNIFVWFWTLAQWNCMARSASIDPLAFHNFKIGQDSTICKYDDQKADKSGERLSEKNIYANPFEWTQCFWTGMGIYVALNCDALASHERLFLKEGVKEGAASTRYCEQLLTIITKHKDEVLTQMRLDHFNPYGLRKGSATHAVSGTTHAPSLPSIARRGEWSQGLVLDVYWHFAATGDHYLGRILACLLPNSPGFATLPPHFNIPNPLNNEHVQKGMQMLYGPILANYKDKPNDPTPMLLRCFACLIYHIDSLKAMMVKIPGHDFAKLSLLHDHQLMEQLKPLVTTNPTEGIMTVATGIPPHIELANQVVKVLDTITHVYNKFDAQTTNLIEAVKDAIENKAWESGHVTGTKLVDILQEHQTTHMKAVDERLNEVREEFARAMSGGSAAPVGVNVNSVDSTSSATARPSCTFMHDGKFYGVPKNFQFPKPKLREAVRFWLCGQSVLESGQQRVKQMAPNHGQTSRIERQQFGSNLQEAMRTPCPIPGCQWSIHIPGHHCHNSANGCKKKVHGLCYRESSWGRGDDGLWFFCSATCKQQRLADDADENQNNT